MTSKFVEKSTKLSLTFMHSILFFILLLVSISSKAQNCSLNANIDKTICANEELFLEGSKGGTFKFPGTTTWSQISGPAAIITSPNSLNTTVTGIVGGNIYTFRLSATCGDNAKVFDDVDYTVKIISTANAGLDIGPICPSTDNKLSGNALLAGESGEWTIVSGNNAGVTVTNPTDPESLFSVSSTSSGTSTLRWTVTNSNGCLSFDEMLITNRGGISNITAGTDQVLGNCYSTTQSTRMAASFDGGLRGEVGRWSVVSGPNIPTIDDITSNTTQVSNLIEGTYILRWTVTGICALGFDDVQITVPAPVGNNSNAIIVPGNTTYCDSRTSIVLTGNTPNYNNETVTWTQNSGPPATIVSPNSPSTTITGLDGISSYTFAYTINNSVTGCTSTTTATTSFAIPATLSIISTNPIISTCDSSDSTIEYTDTGTGIVQYSIVSAPVGFTSVPTNYVNLGSSPATISGLTVPGSYIVRVRKSANGVGCSDLFQDVTLIVSKTPSPSNGGTNQKLGCGVSSTSLAGNQPDVGIGTWNQVTGPNTAFITDPYDPLTAISNLANGFYIFRWQISGGPACSNSQNDVSVRVVSSPPTVVDAGLDQNVCANTPILLAGNDPDANEEGSWTVSPSAGIVFSPDNTKQNATVTGLLANTAYTFTWTITNTCGSISDDVIVTTNASQGPIPSNAGEDECYANGTTVVSLNGNDPSPGTGLWTVISGIGTTFSDPTLYNTNVSGLTSGTFEFEWTISNGSCTTTKDRVVITISDDVTQSDAGPDQNICGTTANLTANTPINGIGSWKQISGPIDATISNANNATTTVSNLIDGSYIFRWRITNGCSLSIDDVQLNVSTQVPIVPNAGANQSICGATSVTMSGNDVSPGTGLWSIVSGPNIPNIVNPNSPTTTITGLEAGLYSFRWTSSGSAFCNSLSDDILVDVKPNSNAGTDQSYCFADSVSLNGNDGSAGTWTQIGTTPNSATITATSSSSAIASGLIAGTYTFEYTITPTGSCIPLSDTVTITISSNVSGANAGIDQFFCGATQFLLQGNNPGGGLIGTWQLISGPTGGTFLPSANSPTAIYNNATPGTYVFSWTIANGSCSSTDEVRIENPATPSIADAGADQDNVCLFETTMKANNPTNGVGNWTLVSKPSKADDPIIVNPILYNTIITNLYPIDYPGTYVFRWTISNGTCPSTFDDVAITVYQSPSIPNAGPDQNLCNVTVANLSGTEPIVGTGVWTQFSGPTAIIDSPTLRNSTISGLTTATYEFRWTITNTVCSLYDNVIIVNNPAPTIASTAGTNTTVCKFEEVKLIGNTPTVGTGLWTQTSGNTATIIDPASPTTLVSGTDVGNYTFRWTISELGCPPSFNDVTITITEPPTIATVGNDQIICDGDTATLEGNTPTNGTGTWSIISGGVGATITDPNNPTTTVTGLPIGTTRLRWTISNGTCAPYSAGMNIIVNPKGQVNQPSNEIFCNTTIVSIIFETTNPDLITTFDWTNTNPAIGLPSNGNGNLSFTATNTSLNPIVGTIEVTPTFTNGGISCEGPSKTFTITVNPSGQAEPINNQELCTGNSTNAVTFSTNNPLGITTYSWTNNEPSIGLASSGTGNIASFTAINNGSNPIVATIIVTPTLDDGTISCSGIPVVFTITVNPSPSVNSASAITMCSGAAVNYTITSATAGSSFIWSRPTVSNITEPGINNQTSNPINETLTNTSLSPIVVPYSITEVGPSPTNCPGIPFDLNVTVNPTPNVSASPTSQLICSGTTTNIGLTTTVTGATVTYSWTAAVMSGSATGFTNGNGSTIAEKITNTGTTQALVRYTITPAIGTCTGIPITVDIIVNPSGNVIPSGNQTACNNTNTAVIAFSTTNTDGATTYTWTNNNTAIGLGANGNGNIPSFLATNAGTAPIFGNIIVIPTYTNNALACVGPSDIFNYTINPIGQVDQPIDQAFCNTEVATVTFTTQNTGGTTTYDWTNNNTAIGLGSSGSGNLSFTATNNTPNPITASIVVTPTFSYGGTSCTGPSKTFILTIDPSGQVEPINDQELCTGDTTTAISFTTNNSYGITTYTWTNSEPSIGLASSGSGNIAAFTALNTGTNPVVATITVTPLLTSVSRSCTGPTETFTITVNPIPSLSSATTKTICSGDSVNYTITSATAGTTYVWNRATVAGITETGVTGQTNNPINETLTNTTNAPIIVRYEIIPTGPANTNCVGATFNLDVTVNPIAQVNPIGSQVVCNGATTSVSFSSTNTGGTTSYTWTNNTPSIGLATSGIEDIPEFTAVNSGTAPVVATIIVTPVFKNGGVDCTGPTETFKITVNPKPIGVSTLKDICSGDIVNQVLTTSPFLTGTTFTYPAPIVTGGITGGSGRIIGSDAAITDVLVNPTRFIHTATYTVTPKGPEGCIGDPFTIEITVDPVPEGVQETKTICSGKSVDVNLKTSPIFLQATYTYPTPIVTGGITGGNSRLIGSGDNITDVLINSTSIPQTAIYTVTPKSPGGCIGLPFTVTITVNPTAQVNLISSQVVCNGDSTTAIAFATTNTGGTTTYNWTNDTPSIGLVASGTGTIDPFTAKNTGTNPVVATITVTPSFNNGSVDCIGPTETFTITVNPTAQVNPIASQVVCNGATTSVSFSSTNTGGTTSFTWTNNTPSIGLATSGIEDIPAFTAVNSGTAPVVATIIVTPVFKNGGVDCTGPTKTFTITVNPTAQINSITSQVACNNSPTTAVVFSTINSGGTTTYNWTNDTTTIGLPASGSGDISSFTALNTSTSPIVASITVTPTFNNNGINCTGPSKSFTITVNPKPIGLNAVKEICSGDTVNQSLTTNPLLVGTTFTYNSPTVTGGITGGSARIIGSTADITDILVNPTRFIQTATYTIIPKGPEGCAGETFTVEITVDPVPEGVEETKTICSGDAVNVNLKTSPTFIGTTYSYPAPIMTGGITGGNPRIIGNGDDITDVLINPTSLPQTAIYTVTPKSPGGCIGQPFTVTITVNPTPIGIEEVKVICSGETVNFNFKTNPLVIGTTYTYPAPIVTGGITGGNARNIGSTDDITDVLLNPTGVMQFAQYTITPKSPAGCIGQPFTIIIVVNPTPIGVNEFKTIYSEEAVNQILQTNPKVLGTTFTYPTPIMTGSLSGGTPRNIGSVDDITDVLINPSSVTQTATYTVTPTSREGCIGNPFIIEVTVLAVFIGETAKKTICSGDAVNQDLKTSPVIPGTTYTYPAPVVTGGITGGQARLTGTPDDITDVLVNPTRFVQKATYTVTPKGANGYIGAPFFVEILVEPTPNAPVASTTLQPSCSTPTGTITVTSPIGIGYNYSIDGIDYSNTSGIFTAVSPGNYTVTVKTALGCISVGTDVTVDPQPITPFTPIVTEFQGTCSLITGSVLLTGLPPGNWTITQTGTVNANYTGNTPELSISGLTPGTYSFKVTNGVGCISLPTADVKIINVICAIDDSNPTPINGYIGGIAIANVLDNDVLNNLAIIPSDVVLSAIPSSIPIGIIFDTTTGQVSVKPQTKSGTYTFDYTICEVANPSNCSTASVTIKVASASIVANDDTNPIPIYGVVGGMAITTVLDNDELNGIAVIPIEVVIRTLPNAVPPELIFNQTTGEVGVKPGTPANLYSFDYTICEVKNPLNCDTATVIVDVEVPTIALIKTVEFVDEDHDGNAKEGETLAYKFTVTNTGSQPLTNITITDPLIGLVISGGPISLGVGESDSTTFTAQYTLTQADINRGNVTNQATVSGTSPELIVVTDLSDNSNNAENDPTVQPITGCTIEVNNAMSPNGDGTNDVFNIKGIECYPNNTVQIFNRWGVLVYEEVGYNNADKAFTGYTKGRKTEYKKEKLPTGTYFYIIKYTDFNSNNFEIVKYLYIGND